MKRPEGEPDETARAAQEYLNRFAKDPKNANNPVPPKTISRRSLLVRSGEAVIGGTFVVSGLVHTEEKEAIEYGTYGVVREKGPFKAKESDREIIIRENKIDVIKVLAGYLLLADAYLRKKKAQIPQKSKRRR